MSGIDPQGIEVATNIAPGSEVYICLKNSESVQEERREPEAIPAGLMKTFVWDGNREGCAGWKMVSVHAREADRKVQVHQQGIQVHHRGRPKRNNILKCFREGEVLEEELRDAREYYPEERELNVLGTNKIRESMIESARLQRPAAMRNRIVIDKVLEKTQQNEGLPLPSPGKK